MKKTLCIIITIFISISAYAKISLKEVVKKGIEKSYAISNEKMEKKIADTEKKLAEIDRLFNIGFNGLYLYKSEQPELNMPDINISPTMSIPGIHMLAGTKHIFDFNLSIKQSIYTGGILANRIKLSEIKGLQHENQRKLIENKLGILIKNSFLNFKILLLQEKYLQLVKKDLENHLNKLNDYFKEELVKKSDILETELKLEEIKMNIEDIKSKITDAEIEFGKLTGVDTEEIDNRYGEDILNYKESIDYFKKNHPIIKTFTDSIKTIIIKKKIDKGRYLPQIGGFYELHYGKPGINFFKTDWSLYFQGGINVSFKLFDWGKLKKSNRISDYYIKKIENQENEYIEETEEKLKKLYSLKRILKQKIKIADKLLKISIENSNLKGKRFREKQEDNMNYLSSIIKKELYKILKEQILIKMQIINININGLINRR
jgi:hypothetical protein